MVCVTMRRFELEVGAAEWVAAFHAGSRTVLEDVYRTHFDVVSRVVARILPSVDAEMAIQELFCRLVDDAKLRQNFQGGNLDAWLSRVAHNYAIDVYRQRRRQASLTDDVEAIDNVRDASRLEEKTNAKLAIETFMKEHLPPRWHKVFEARFLQQLGKSEAAAALGMNRTTLAYQEGQIRKLLTRFLLARSKT